MPKKVRSVKKQPREKDYKNLTNKEIRSAIKTVKAVEAELAPDILAQLADAIEVGEDGFTLDGVSLPKPNLYGLVAVLPFFKKLAVAGDDDGNLDLIGKIIWILKHQEEARADLKNPPEQEVIEMMTGIPIPDVSRYFVLIKRAFIDDMEALKKSLSVARR